MTGNCKGKRSDNKVLKGCKTKMTDVWPNSSHQILTCINTEPAKVSCCTVQRIKVLKHVQQISKVFRHQIHSNSPCKNKITSLGRTSNVCNLRRSGSADLLVKQLQRLCDYAKSLCTSWCERLRQAPEKDNSINNNWEKLCSNTWSAVEASLFNWSTSTLLRVKRLSSCQTNSKVQHEN